MAMTKVLDLGYVNLVESWGSDERIIEAARMSTNKGLEGWGPLECRKCENVGWINDLNEDGSAFEGTMCPKCRGAGSLPGDEKLLKYLWDHHHTSPFEMAGLVFEIYAPIFVVREWQRHRVQALHEGLSFNEMSGRYTELPNDYYTPSIERIKASKQSKTNKQGSEEGFSDHEALLIQERIGDIQKDCRAVYVLLLDQGAAREVARLVLPVSQYSRLRASANLWGWLHFLKLRLDTSAQWEIREYAKAVSDIIKGLFPRTHALFAGSL